MSEREEFLESVAALSRGLESDHLALIARMEEEVARSDRGSEEVMIAARNLVNVQTEAEQALSDAFESHAQLITRLAVGTSPQDD